MSRPLRPLFSLSLLVAGLAPASARADLIGEWRFNESGVTAHDGAPGKLDLVLRRDSTNAFDAHTPPGAGVSGGPADRAFDPNAWPHHKNGNAAALGTLTSDFTHLAAFTISFWTKIEKVPRSGQTAFCFNATQGIRIAFYPNGNEGWATIALGAHNIKTAAGWLSEADIGRWVNLAVTYDTRLGQDALKVYRADADTPFGAPFSQSGNGHLLGPLDNTDPLVTATTGLLLGNVSTVNRTWPGLLDDVRIFNTALSPYELDALRRQSLDVVK